jgi:tetratricopeptide (TPR) repeat protein
MKTAILSGFYPANIIRMITLLFIFFFWFFWTLNINAYAAGAPERPSTTGAEKRENANMHFEEGLKLQKAGNYKEASIIYEKAVRADPEYAEAWSNLGFTYRKQGYYDKAVEAYKKAIRLSPNLAEAHEYLGEAYAEMGKFDSAEKELHILRELGSHEADELAEFIAKSKAK